MAQADHPPGTFCWTELLTPDPAGTKKFFADVFGWTYRDDPIPDGGSYTMILLGDGPVGGMYKLSDEMAGQGTPPHWSLYVLVEDVDAAASRARELGGDVMVDPFDVMEFGRMAVIGDPTGAALSLWQPKLHGGWAYTDGRPGSVCWSELLTRDVDRAGAFYRDLFGWSIATSDVAGMQYNLFKRGDVQVGGMMAITNPEEAQIPAHWSAYFAVADCDAAFERAKSAGAEIIHAPTDIPTVGRFAVIRDPQGAVSSILSLSAR